MKFNELLASRFANGLNAVLGLAEQDGVSTVSPEIMPVFVSEGERPEHSYVKSERLAWGFGDAAASAGVYSYITLINPQLSGMLITVERIVLANGGGPGRQLIGNILDSQYSPLSAMVSGFYQARDLRWGKLNGSVMGQVRQGNNSAVLGINQDLAVNSLLNTTVDLPDLGIVLYPGTGIGVAPVAVNTGITASYFWRERIWLPEEV